MQRAASFVILGLALCLGVATARAQEPEITAKFHPWGLFQRGTWKTVRVVTETLDDKGRVVSTCTTDTKTTLVDVDDQGVTMEIQASMEVAGKRFDADPQTIRQGFHGELLGPTIKLSKPADSEVVIEGRAIPCKLLQLESVTPNGKSTVSIYYSATVAPYILKRESIATDAEGKKELGKTSVEVMALDMPVQLSDGEWRNGIITKTIHRNSNGAVVTCADVLPEVPGGVVGNRSKETDKTGRLLRRSTLTLIDYSDDPNQDRSGLFRRQPPRRRAKQSSR
jgi:hypothetical protein